MKKDEKEVGEEKDGELKGEGEQAARDGGKHKTRLRETKTKIKKV